MNAIKSALFMACVTVGFTAQAKIGDVENLNAPVREAAIRLRIDNPLLLQICKANPSLPMCRQVNPAELLVQISPEDYENLQRLRTKRSHNSQFLAELGFMVNQERALNERILQQLLRLSDAESKAIAQSIENVRLAVETQQQLDERFGFGGLKISLQQGSHQQPIQQQGDAPSGERQMAELK